MLSDRWIDDDLGPFIYREMVVEKSAYDKAVEALKKHHCSVLPPCHQCQALRELGEK